jgi:hypothetical protein
MLAIEAIKFNHNPGAATDDALNIRKDLTQFISVPEWRRFICVNPEDSRAAYAVRPTHNKPITIEVSLSLLYRDRLATPAGRPNCNPQPGTRQRRIIV